MSTGNVMDAVWINATIHIISQLAYRICRHACGIISVPKFSAPPREVADFPSDCECMRACVRACMRACVGGKREREREREELMFVYVDVQT